MIFFRIRFFNRRDRRGRRGRGEREGFVGLSVGYNTRILLNS